MNFLKENELDNYICEVLQFPEWKEAKEKDGNGIPFITELMHRFMYHSYFQNIDMIATPQIERRSPSAEDCISIGLQNSGGVCIHQNFWFVTILQSLGFQAYTAAGCYRENSNPEDWTHCIGILKLSDDDIYAVDVGSGNPVSGPIPLNQLPYFGSAAEFRYEYRFNEEINCYERWQLDGALLGGKFENEKKEHLRYKFTLKPHPFLYFEEILIPIFTHSESSTFLRNLILYRSLGESAKRFVLVFGKAATLFDGVDRITTKFECYMDMKSFVLKHFPNIKAASVHKALTYLDNVK